MAAAFLGDTAARCSAPRLAVFRALSGIRSCTHSQVVASYYLMGGACAPPAKSAVCRPDTAVTNESKESIDFSMLCF